MSRGKTEIAATIESVGVSLLKWVLVSEHARMMRWHAKFRAVDEGREHDMTSDNYLDDIHAFFQNCYHLKDWIKNDKTGIPATVRNSVEGYINSSDPLKLCADICNSLKHLTLTNHRSGENPTFGKKEFGLELGGGATKITLKWQVDTSSGPKDAFTLGTECVGAWDKFFATHGL
jgi:hypothetical protein